MKRYISLVLVAFVLVGLLAVPSYAAETVKDSFYYDVLDYGYIIGKNNNTFTCNLSTTVSYALPNTAVVKYVDLYVSSSSKPSVEVFYDNTWRSLNVDYVTGDIYHVYGYSKSAYYTEMMLRFTCSTLTYLEIFRFYAYSAYDTSVDLSGISGVSASGLDNYVELDFSPGSPASLSWKSTFSPGSNYYSFAISSEGWRHYDYVDVSVVIDTATIDSITCTYNDSETVPISVNPLSMEGSSGSAQFVDIRLDFTGIDPSEVDDPILTFYGSENVGEFYNYIQVWNAVGILSLEPVASDTFFLRNIWNSIKSGFNSVVSSITASSNSIISSISSVGSKIETWGQNIVNAITGDPSAAEKFQDQVDQSNKELNDMAAVMDSFTTPDLNSINVDVGSFVSSTDINSLSAPMALLFDSSIVTTCIMISIILATVMFVLYGKR